MPHGLSTDRQRCIDRAVSFPPCRGRTGRVARPRQTTLTSTAALPPSQPQRQSQPQGQPHQTTRRTYAPLWRKDAPLRSGDNGNGGADGVGGLGSGRHTLDGGGDGDGGYTHGDADDYFHDGSIDYVDGVDGTYDAGGDGSEGPLGPSLAEELQELERLYGTADRTRSSYRSRQKWLDRRAAEREAVYGARHRDADVRLLALRRYLAAAGKLRRRGRFAANDAMPRPSTWHKLPPATQRQILDERATELQKDVGLSMPAGRRLYVAAPGLLCDISYGVAARLRALAARLGCSVEGAAAAIAARPLLGELRLDPLEATAAELSVWVGGCLPLGLALQRLAEEPSLAAEGSRALISRCEALCESLGLSRPAALEYMVRQPRLMTLDPRVIPARVAAARRLVQLAAGRPAAVQQQQQQQEDTQAPSGPASAPPVPPPPSLLLCTGPQLAERLTLLQRLLALPPPAAAAMLAEQPALALQPPAAVAAAVDFLCAHLPAPPAPQPPEVADTSAARALGASSSAGGTALPPSGGRPDLVQAEDPRQGRRRRQPQAAQQPGGGGQRLSRASSSPTTLQPPPPPQLPPPHVQTLVKSCPHVLLLEPRRAAAALDVLAMALAEAEAAEPGAEANYGVGSNNGGRDEGEEGEQEAPKVERAWGRARRTAAAMAARAPRLLLCSLIPPAGGGGGGAGGGRGGGGRVAGPGLTRSRQASILALVKSIHEAQRKRHVDAASLALDEPGWPRPLVPLPFEYGIGAVAPAAAGGTAAGAAVVSVLDRAGDWDAVGSRGAAGSGSPAAAGEAALRAAAAAAGVGPIPIDLGLREAELLRVLAPRLLSEEQGAENVRPEAGAVATPYDPEGMYDTSSGGIGTGGGFGSLASPAVRGVDAAVRSWLWRDVLVKEPPLLLLPSSQLVATLEALCAWLAVPSDALSYYLFPYGMAATRPALSERQGAAEAAEEAAPGATAALWSGWRRRHHHATLLVRRPDTLQRAGYRLWAWLGGAAAAAAADVAAVLRALPGLLYDGTTMRTCARVLFELLGGAAAAGDADGAAAAALSFEEYQGSGLPAWVRVMPSVGAEDRGSGSSDWGSGAAARCQPQSDAVPAMPPAAAALLLRFPAEILSDEVLQLLAAAPPAAPPGAAGAGAAAVESQAGGLAHRLIAAGPAAEGVFESGGGGGGGGAATVAAAAAAAATGTGASCSRLGRAVGLLSELLGVGCLAAAALVLTTHGSVARLVEELPPAATADIGRAMSAIRRGDAWRRELRRYLYGNTSYGIAGGESLEAVSASARELLGVLREWRRAERLEALEAAGMADAVSFATVLQLPEDEWRDLALRLQVPTTVNRTHAPGDG